MVRNAYSPHARGGGAASTVYVELSETKNCTCTSRRKEIHFPFFSVFVTVLRTTIRVENFIWKYTPSSHAWALKGGPDTHCSCMPVSPGFLNMNWLAQNLLCYTNFCDRLILPHLTILWWGSDESNQFITCSSLAGDINTLVLDTECSHAVADNIHSSCVVNDAAHWGLSINTAHEWCPSLIVSITLAVCIRLLYLHMPSPWVVVLMEVHVFPATACSPWHPSKYHKKPQVPDCACALAGLQCPFSLQSICSVRPLQEN